MTYLEKTETDIRILLSDFEEASEEQEKRACADRLVENVKAKVIASWKNGLEAKSKQRGVSRRRRKTYHAVR